MIGSFPLIIRPAFTLGGTGGGIAYNLEEFEEIVKTGLDASMTNQARAQFSPLTVKNTKIQCEMSYQFLSI